MYTDILYPTDGSDGAEAALENVRVLAETYDATVHVLHVADTSHHALGLGHDPKEHASGMVGDPQGGVGGMVGQRMTTEEMRDQLQEYGQALVSDVADRLGDLRTETVVDSGDPHTVILEYVDGHSIDLVVMGTHGRTGLDRYLIGSVTEKIVRLSDVPVVSVRQDE